MTDIITCPLLNELDWLKHGFYGRKNGIARNTEGTHAFDGYENALFLNQTFSDTVAFTDQPAPEGGADASVTNEDNMALAIKTADCVPLLMACSQSKVIGAVHVSWHTCLAGIVGKTIAHMVDLGADPRRIRAALGPCLQQKSFQFGSDLRERFLKKTPEAIGFFMPFRDKWLFDMSGLVQWQLQQANLRDHNIWQSPIDTYTNEHYFSFRSLNKDPESEELRNISIISKIKA